MKVRIKFTKTGDLRFIGHLDIMRYFQKLIRRCDLPVAYSEGFSPHQILSFTPPLPLGAVSMGEYADVTVTDIVPSREAIKLLNEHSVPEIRILSFKELDDKAKNAMSVVCAARYEICLRNKSDYPYNLKEDMEAMLKEDTVIVSKVTKKKTEEIDLKKFIYDYSFKDDDTLDVTLSAGSVNNIKPELIFMALFEKKNLVLNNRGCFITRIDMFSEENGNLISLDDIGKDIK